MLAWDYSSFLAIMGDGMEDFLVENLPAEMHLYFRVRNRFGFSCSITKTALKAVFERAEEKVPDEFRSTLSSLGYAKSTG